MAITNNNTLNNDLFTLTYLYNLQNILTEIGVNLNLINSGGNGQLITVRNANLFELAALYYGDATLWEIIANANNLYVPQLTGVTILIIPPNNGSLINNPGAS